MDHRGTMVHCTALTTSDIARGQTKAIYLMPQCILNAKPPAIVSLFACFRAGPRLVNVLSCLFRIKVTCGQYLCLC